MKIIHDVIGAGCVALTLGAASLHAQNVGINTSNPLANQLKAANERFTALAAQMEELKQAVTNVQQKVKARYAPCRWSNDRDSSATQN